jgi:hypothetical protein
MEPSPQRPEKREFHCPSCRGRILIPWDLPATTSPCPYCGVSITSPEPEPKVPWPKPEIPATPAAPALVEKPPAAPPVAPTVEAKPAPLPPRSEPRQKEAAKPGLLKDWLPVTGFFLLLAIGGAFAVNLALREKEKPVAAEAPVESVDELMVRENHYIHSGWRKDAERILAGFIAATTVRDKIPYVIGGPEMESRMREFYGDGPIDDSDTPAENFAARDLTEEDRRRGMFLMVFDQPPQIDMREFFQPLASLEVQYGLEEADLLLSSVARTRNFAMDPLRVHAFFKRTPDGIKLDWEVFVQTKHRLFERFVDSPEEGRTGVFRVLVMQDVADAGQSRAGMEAYLMADPAHRGQTARVAVARDSEIGRILSEIHWRGIPGAEPKARSATVELKWSGPAGGRTLEIKRLICWEFLGLGGVESTTRENPE